MLMVINFNVSYGASQCSEEAGMGLLPAHTVIHNGPWNPFVVLAQEPGSASPGLCVQVDGETWGKMNGQGQEEGVGEEMSVCHRSMLSYKACHSPCHGANENRAAEGSSMEPYGVHRRPTHPGAAKGPAPSFLMSPLSAKE